MKLLIVLILSFCASSFAQEELTGVPIIYAKEKIVPAMQGKHLEEESKKAHKTRVTPPKSAPAGLKPIAKELIFAVDENDNRSNRSIHIYESQIYFGNADISQYKELLEKIDRTKFHVDMRTCSQSAMSFTCQAKPAQGSEKRNSECSGKMYKWKSDQALYVNVGSNSVSCNNAGEYVVCAAADGCEVFIPDSDTSDTNSRPALRGTTTAD